MFINKPVDGAVLDSMFGNSDESSLAWSIALTNGVFIPAVICFVGARIFTRAFMTKQLFADDYIMLSASFFFLLQSAINLAAMRVGFGEHIWNVPDRFRGMERVQEMNFASLVLLSISICLAKVSIITTLLHIFTPQTVKFLRYLLLATGLVVVVCCVTEVFLILFQCHPIYLSWKISEIGRQGTCMGFQAAILGGGTVNLITDIIITVAPIRYFLQLNMPMRQKLCLCGLFLSGAIACIISFVRVGATKGVADNLDVTYGAAGYYNWSVAETGLCIITGSIPPLRPLIATIVPDFFKTAGITSVAGCIKGSLRRPSFSRMSSRRSSADAMASSRRNSDAASTTAPVNNTKDHDLRGPSRVEQRPEPEAPKAGAGVVGVLRAWSPMRLVAAAKQGIFKLGARLPRAGSRTQTGRPLSVINELDETMDASGRRQKTVGTAPAPTPAGSNGFEYIANKLGGGVQDAKWKVSSWRRQRSQSMTGGAEDNIAIQEIVSKSERKEETV